MELRVLKYFLTVAKKENISVAADTLHITQPTLSRQIMELEKELGKKLFLRGSRKLVLTEEGILLKKRAEEIIELVEKTQSEILSSDDVIKGDVYIGSGETDAVRFIAKVAKNLQKEYPKIKYHLFSGNANDVIEKLDKGLLDFGILIGKINLEKYNYIKLPTKDTWGLLMRKDHFLSSKNSIKIDDLLNIPLLCSIQAITSEISQWTGENFNKLNLVGTYNLIFNASLMVEEGIGCALCFDNLVKFDKNSPLCFRILEPKLESEIYFIWKRNQIFSKAAKKFLEKIKDSF